MPTIGTRDYIRDLNLLIFISLFNAFKYSKKFHILNSNPLTLRIKLIIFKKMILLEKSEYLLGSQKKKMKLKLN